MPDSQFDPPALDELEVSIFGPGYGEAILLHIGENRWILVDSCIDPASKLPTPLKYLSDLNVAVENSVKLIVATHWHNDHIRGLSTVIKACKSAEFVISNALNVDEFRKLIVFYRKPAAMKNPPLDEFCRVFEVLKARKEQKTRLGSPKFATADRLLYRDCVQLTSGTIEARISALSPSDDAIQQARLAFARLLPEENEYLSWIAPPSPNYSSVVLWVEVGNHKILLGSDLERTTDPGTGWSIILESSTVISGKASVFKVPHHGSENGHHERMWSELLVEEPFAILTPYTRGKKPLPSREDIKRITALTPNAYATAPARRQQPRWQNRVVKDFVEQMTRSIQNVNQGWGHVRLRKRINETSNFWQVELFGDAYPLNM